MTERSSDYGSQESMGLNDIKKENGVFVDINTNQTAEDGRKKDKPGFSASIRNFHSSVRKYKAEQKAKIKFLISFLIHIVLLGYFCWATEYFIRSSDLSLSATTCDGYGFLMILYIVIYFGVFYFVIFKPIIKPILKEPVSKAYSRISSIRYVGLMIHGVILISCIIFVIIDSWSDTQRLISMAGLVFFILFGFLISSNHSKVNWDMVLAGLDLQFVFGLFAIRWETGRNIFICIGDKATTFLSYANNGSSFVYGDELIYTNSVFAFQSLSTIFFVGMMVNILYHFGIMQKVVVGFGQFLRFFMGTSICESVNAAANIILGQSESPMLLKPYLEHMTDSEIHAIICSGFATVSGSVLAAYISFGASASDLITSSVMSAPAALCYSKLLCPEVEQTKATKETIKLIKTPYTSVLDAASKGALQGMELVLGIIANVIAFIAFVAFMSGVLEWCGSLVGYTDEAETWAVYRIVGYVFMPMSYLMGVPWDECHNVGQLIGIKTIVNEFAAFERMGQLTLTARTKVIATYAICGFANPGSIGIMIAALGALVPSKREVITRVVMKGFIGGAMVCFMTACIAAMLMPASAL